MRTEFQEKTMTKCIFAPALIALATGCGGGGDDPPDPPNVPSEQVLCALTIGKSSPADALRALGPAASSSGGGDISTLDYQYGDFSRARSVSEIAGLSLYFDEDELFHDASVVNIPFPQCWKDQQAHERELTGN
jgi:hypothetical protein